MKTVYVNSEIYQAAQSAMRHKRLTSAMQTAHDRQLHDVLDLTARVSMTNSPVRYVHRLTRTQSTVIPNYGIEAMRKLIDAELSRRFMAKHFE